MDIINVIDKLEALVNTSRRLPATRSRLVDDEKVMELVEQLRLSIPQDVRSAKEVIERKDTILNQAQINARRTRSEAEEEFKTRLDQNDLLVSARRQSEEMLSEAERKASRLMELAETEARTNRTESDAYVVETLRSLEGELTSVLASVRKGLDTIGATVYTQ
jgi:cell division septum initiation protein DivIVA